MMNLCGPDRDNISISSNTISAGTSRLLCNSTTIKALVLCINPGSIKALKSHRRRKSLTPSLSFTFQVYMNIIPKCLRELRVIGCVCDGITDKIRN